MRFSIPKSVKGLYTVFPDTIVLGIHFVGDVPQPVLVFAEVLGDTGDGGDVIDFVDVQGSRSLSIDR